MKKFIALLLVITLVASCAITAFASFPDLEDSSWDWAREEIDEMTKENIIAGYTDGRFGPADGVTKLQSLLLMARILGYNEEENEEIIALADELYLNAVSEYNVSNPSEVAYLLYFGIISEDELSDYLGNASDILKRYEAAVLLTKVAGAENEVKKVSGVTLSYKDTPSIPASVRKYVKFVNDKKYMVGMTEDTFEPETTVSRAQMAVMLHRIMKDLDVTFIAGNFVSASGTNVTLMQDGTQNVHNVATSKAVVKADGKACEMEDIPVNAYTVITYLEDTARFVSAVSPIVEKEVYGTVTSIVSDTKNKINVRPFGETQSETINLDKSTVYTYLGKKATFSSITKGDTVTVSMKGGVGTSVVIASRSEVLTGKFESVTYEPYVSVTFTTGTGETLTKTVDEKVSISRNGSKAELRELLLGDRLTLTMENDVAKQIKVSSSNSELSGVIEEIHISSNPYLTIKCDGDSNQYPVANNVEVLLDEVASTIYDLRIGFYVTVKLESNTISSVTSTSTVSSSTIVGTVESVNTSYNFFNMVTVNTTTGATEKLQVFVKKNGGTKYIDSVDGTVSSLGKMKAGDSVIITGLPQLDGSYIASAVVIMAPAGV